MATDVRSAGMAFFVVLAVAASSAAQVHRTVAGTVRDEAGVPLAGARVVAGIDETATDADGRFVLSLPVGPQVLQVLCDGFLPARRELALEENVEGIEIRLRPTMVVSDTVTVDAVRAAEGVPVTKRNLESEEIARRSYGQDVPALLAHTPSVTWYSDSGLGSNYSYFSLRGIGQTRINLTFDGAPLNDPAEHALYFNNFHDFTSAVESIQIQRGVGTSSVGSPSFGGSVNFASVRPRADRQTELRVGFGSHDARRASLAMHSGLLGQGWSLYGRVSYAASDGYREHSGTEHDSVFLNAAWQGERQQLKLVSFSGRGRTGLSFLAVEPEVLELNPRFNPLAPEERDRFGQDFAQLQYVRATSGDSVLTASLYYNGADGWYRLWADPETRSELLQFGIDQHFVGSMLSVTRTKGRLQTQVGAHYNDFRGEHTLDVGASRIYVNTGLKQQANVFTKLQLELGDWLFFGDLQLRWARFAYRGSVDIGSIDWRFVNPRLGVRYAVSPASSLYASLGRAEREPGRLDLLAGEDDATVAHDLEAVAPEEVVDLELGFEYRTQDVDVQAVLYDMEFANEIAATGELSDVGLPLRTNVDDSYRRGLELDVRWRLAKGWTVRSSLNLSRNRIRRWTQFYDIYDASGQWTGSEARLHRDVPPLLTPEAVVNQSIEWSGKNVELGLDGRFVGESFLDNTGDRRFRAPRHLSLGLRGVFDLPRIGSIGRPRLRVHVDNLLDEKDHYPAGYSYRFITRDDSGRDTIGGIPYYYPLAGRTVAVSVEFSL